MGSLGWILIQYDWDLNPYNFLIRTRRGNLKHTEGRQCEYTASRQLWTLVYKALDGNKYIHLFLL